MIEWRDPHYPEWAVTEAMTSGKWLGKVSRRKVPTHVMTMETTETIWTSEPCDTEREALRQARERIEAGGPWDS